MNSCSIQRLSSKSKKSTRTQRSWSLTDSCKNEAMDCFGRRSRRSATEEIQDSSPQIKARGVGIHPSILILQDRTARGHLDPYQVRVAMYGLEQMHIVLPPFLSANPYSSGMTYGPKRKMTPECNTSISAIGVLNMRGPDKVTFSVYHNTYAAVPLQPTLFAAYDVFQFKLEEERFGVTAQWKEVSLRKQQIT